MEPRPQPAAAPPPERAPAEILADDERQLLDMQFALGGGDIPNVALLAYETPRQLRRLKKRLEALLPEYRHLHLDFTGQRVVSLNKALRELPAVQAARRAQDEAAALGQNPKIAHALHISGLEGTLLVELTSGEQKFLATLNEEREVFFRDLPFVKILWVTPWEFGKVQKEVLDFWSWLSLKHRFVALPEEVDPLPVRPPDPPPVPFYTPERKKYIAQLQAQLDRHLLGKDEAAQRAAADLCKLLAGEYDEANDFAQSELMWKKALAHLQRFGSEDVERAQICSQIGATLTGLRKFQEAGDWLEKARMVTENTENWEHNWANDMKRARLFFEEKKWHEALEVIESCREIAAENDSQTALSVSYQTLGLLHEEIRQFPEALANYRKALECQQKTKQPALLGAIFYQIGMVHHELHQFSEALTNYQKALEWQQESGYQHLLGLTFSQIGKALPLYEEILQDLESQPAARRQEDRDDLAAAHLHLGVCYLHRAGEITRSEPEKTHLETAFALARNLAREEGDATAWPLYYESGHWLLVSRKKELGGWFASKSKKAEWSALREELLAAPGRTAAGAAEWLGKIEGLKL